jgi:flagellar basal-body rod protein FlgB
MNLGNMSQSQFVYDFIKKSMEAADTNSQVIANNIANVNTANYKRYYVSFQNTLNNAIQMKVTNPKDITNGDDFGSITVNQDNTSSMNADGNNVDIDAEMSNQAQNTLMYEALTNQASTRLSMEKYVITGGGN